jgi:hypothetical protein
MDQEVSMDGRIGVPRGNSNREKIIHEINIMDLSMHAYDDVRSISLQKHSFGSHHVEDLRQTTSK